MARNDDLPRAWAWREARGLIGESGALRVFHGPGEGRGAHQSWAIDRFVEGAKDGAKDGGKDHYWITAWEGGGTRQEAVPEEFVEFLVARGAASIVWLGRPERGIPATPRALHGEPPSGRFEVAERNARFWIQLLDARHPGLFLDHSPLRAWLGARAEGWRVLNTFAYTGSLSVAAGLGGAAHVTTLDLSRSTVSWAEENWKLNGLSAEGARFVAGDVFEWLPRLKREEREFDCVILDPPSFSHGKKGSFSTTKDLKRLHALALDLTADGGVLVTSINSANVPWGKYEAEVAAAARERRVSLEVLRRIDLPETFPTPLGDPEARYLKGWILRVRR